MATATPTTPTTAQTPASPNVATLPTGSVSMPGVLVWFVAWIMILGVAWGLAKTRAGRTIVYYALWLAVVLVTVSYYREITGILETGALLTPQQVQSILPPGQAPVTPP